MRIEPAKRLRGQVDGLPGDKSISHRAAILAALARGRTRVSNFSDAADCAATLRCLEQLGVTIQRDGAEVFVEGAGKGPGQWSLREPADVLDCGNSGTTMRLLAGVLAAQPFTATLAGDESLSRRPMARIIEPLELMGARIEAKEGRAPLRVTGRPPLMQTSHGPMLPSAQVKSCILLAGLGVSGLTQYADRHVRTRDHTERLLEWFGLPVKFYEIEAVWPTFQVSITGPAALVARDVSVPGDISSAAFLLAAAAVLPGSDVTVEGVGLNPTRTEILSTLLALGADVRVEAVRESCGEWVGRVRVLGPPGRLAPRSGDEAVRPLGVVEGGAEVERGRNVIRGGQVARLIDELPVLAVVGTQVEGGLEIRDAAELRVKESDRVRAMVENLRAMGARVDEFDDGLRVHGPARLRGARLSSFGDHRVAMACAVAALVAEGESEIVGAGECVAVSFPRFFDLLETLTER